MGYQEYLQIVKELNYKFRYYKSIESLFEYDQWSSLPEEGAEYRQQTAAFIGEEKNALYRSSDACRAAEYLSGVSPDEIGDEIERGLVRTFLSRWRNAVRTPEDTLRKYNLMKADCMNAWKQAREQKDYSIFMPWMKQAFDLKKEIALAVNPEMPAFDTIVGMTDEGLSVKEVSEQFDLLKKGLREILRSLQKAGQPKEDSIPDSDPEQMAAFAQRLARELGYRPERGGFNDRVVHGFTSFMGPRDARVSTYKSGSYNLIFTCLHEAGHAMYSSGSSDPVIRAGMWGGIEGGFHEANARFFENMIGHSRAYWDCYYPQLQEEIPMFREIPEERFYNVIHQVKPTLRRISADEVTYSLHAILRFELERDYFAGKLRAEDMAEAWNDKYEEYLGIRPSNDTEGVLQDMHWAGDYIGYFQSYALGNIYDGQILEAVKREIPDMEEKIRRGEILPVTEWMEKNIWQYGCCMTAGEMIRKLTGHGLDAGPFLRYLEQKYLEQKYQAD